MNIPFSLLILIIGGSIGWLICKLKMSMTLVEIKSKLDIAESINNEIEQKIDKISVDFEELETVSNSLITDKAVLESQLFTSIKSNSEMEKVIADLNFSINEIRNSYNNTLQENARFDVLIKYYTTTINDYAANEIELKNKIISLNENLVKIEKENSSLESKFTESNKRLAEQKIFMEEAEKNLQNTFSALSANALRENNKSFVDFAKESFDKQIIQASGVFEKKERAIGDLVKPLSESLKNMDTKIHDLEDKRIKAYSDIWNNLEYMRTTADGLKKETTNLLGALKTSHNRGRYGEIALKRLVEHAGMFEHCDFEEQVHVEGEDGKLRPDMIIKLPGNKILVVDSKAPLIAYLKIFETDDIGQQKKFLTEHIDAVKKHLKSLSERAYWRQFKNAPDFVIMYIHIESSYGAALQAWPEMIEEAMKNRIIIATPTVLLSILMGVGYSWNQLVTMDNIEKIREAAIVLHDYASKLMGHFISIGTGLKSTVGSYNKAVGSFEARFLPAARDINKLSQAYTKELVPEVTPIEADVRPLTAVLSASKE